MALSVSELECQGLVQKTEIFYLKKLHNTIYITSERRAMHLIIYPLLKSFIEFLQGAGHCAKKENGDTKPAVRDPHFVWH